MFRQAMRNVKKDDLILAEQLKIDEIYNNMKINEAMTTDEIIDYIKDSLGKLTIDSLKYIQTVVNKPLIDSLINKICTAKGIDHLAKGDTVKEEFTDIIMKANGDVKEKIEVLEAILGGTLTKGDIPIGNGKIAELFNLHSAYIDNVVKRLIAWPAAGLDKTGVGKGEGFFVFAFSNAKKADKGDVQIGASLFEIKGKGARIAGASAEWKEFDSSKLISEIKGIISKSENKNKKIIEIIDDKKFINKMFDGISYNAKPKIKIADDITPEQLFDLMIDKRKLNFNSNGLYYYSLLNASIDSNDNPIYDAILNSYSNSFDGSPTDWLSNAITKFGNYNYLEESKWKENLAEMQFNFYQKVDGFKGAILFSAEKKTYLRVDSGKDYAKHIKRGEVKFAHSQSFYDKRAIAHQCTLMI